MNTSKLFPILLAALATNSFGGYIDCKNSAYGSSNGQVGYSISLTDLLRETTSSRSTYNDVGYYKVNGGSWVAFLAYNSDVVGTHGEKTFNVGANLMDLLFRAAGTYHGRNNEFSLAGITYNKATAPVPEPSTLALFGMAMLSFVGYRRFRKN